MYYDLDFIYASSEVELNEKLEEKAAEGWERKGNFEIIDPNIEGENMNAPHFVMLGQTIVKYN